MRMWRLALIVPLLLTAPAAAGVLPVDIPLPEAAAPPGRVSAAQQRGEPLDGTLRIAPGRCAAAVGGSYFRMIQPGGNPQSGPWVENSNSPCADKTYTPLEPGSDGGLRSGSYQPQPAEPFDAGGNGTATRIVRPTNFFGVRFAVASNQVDPQTGTTVRAPVVTRDGTSLSGDLRAIGVAWNRQHFNQGSPKPDGSTPGQTTLPTGTIEPSGGAFTLRWTSTIVGGPFNNFTGLWHLEGTFDGPLGDGTPTRPASRPSAAAQPSAAGGAAAGGGTGSTPNTGAALPASAGLGALALAGLLRTGARRRHA